MAFVETKMVSIIQKSIHPSMFGSQRQQSKQSHLDLPLPSHLPRLIQGGQAFPPQPRDIISPACPGSASGPPPSEILGAQEFSLRRHSSPILKPPNWLLSICRSSGFILSPYRMAELLTFREKPATMALFLYLYSELTLKKN